MPEHLPFQVRLTAKRIDQGTVSRPRHGVHREIPTPQILFKGDFGAGMTLEALVTGTRLALGAGQRVLLAGLRMQKHREITAHLAIAEIDHRLGRRPHHHPVALAHRAAEQLIADRAADQIYVHGSNPASSARKGAGDLVRDPTGHAPGIAALGAEVES